MERCWDVIVVGARCAGATLAALLSRRGVRTLVLESSPRGADMPMSTHLIHPPGIDVLDTVGVGDRVRAAAPPNRALRAAFDDSVVVSQMPPGRAGYCVRRSTIDPWLQTAAEESGAELYDRHRVVDLVRESGRVAGVVAQGPDGLRTFRSDLVVGADGMHSTIARLTGAEEYLVSQGSRAGYWAYFRAPDKWRAAWDSTLEHRGRELRYVFRADGNLVLCVYMYDRNEVATWGRDYRTRLMRAFAASESTRALTEGKEPVGKVVGLLKTRFFYRRPVGPGFALVGDAGHFKDFVTGQGMADAFLDAQRLSRAILEGTGHALERYWRERDVATMPLHFDAIRQGHIDVNDAFMRWVMSRMSATPELSDRVALVFDRKVEPYDLVPSKMMVGFMGAALIRGRFDVLSGFLKAGLALRKEATELRSRKVLLDRLIDQDAASSRAGPGLLPSGRATRPAERQPA